MYIYKAMPYKRMFFFQFDEYFYMDNLAQDRTLIAVKWNCPMLTILFCICVFTVAGGAWVSRATSQDLKKDLVSTLEVY